MTTRQQRFALFVKELQKTGVCRTDPGRLTRLAMLSLEQQELKEILQGVKMPASYYDMDLILLDSPSQHSTPFSSTPFSPSPSPLQVKAHYQYPSHQ